MPAARRNPNGPNIAKAVTHPLRVKMLSIYSTRRASPSEVAEELDEPLGNVSYHTRFLLDLGLLELVDTVPRRGAMEHFYVARPLPQVPLDTGTWAMPTARETVIAQTLRDLGGQVAWAAGNGGFDAPETGVDSWRGRLDDDGVQEFRAAKAKFLGELDKISKRAGDRERKRRGDPPAIEHFVGVILHRIA